MWKTSDCKLHQVAIMSIQMKQNMDAKSNGQPQKNSFFLSPVKFLTCCGLVPWTCHYLSISCHFFSFIVFCMVINVFEVQVWGQGKKALQRQGLKTDSSVINQLTDDRWQDRGEHESINRKTARRWRLNLWHVFSSKEETQRLRPEQWTGIVALRGHDWKPTFIKHLASLATGSTSWHWAQPHSMLQSHH